MSHDVLKGLPVKERRKLLAAEKRARRSGAWGDWEKISLLPGQIGGTGWTNEVHCAYRNKVFSVLCRSTNGATHYAVSSLTQERPTWWEMQRIKDEIAGKEATAVEVYPPHEEIVDGADMFHIWVLPQSLPFSLQH